MEITSERYYPWVYNPALMPFEPFISYEHWHRYRYAAAELCGFVAWTAGLRATDGPCRPAELAPGFDWARVRVRDQVVRWNGERLERLGERSAEPSPPAA